MRVIGIDIGSFSVKFAEIEGSGHSAVLRDFREFTINIEPGQDTRLDKIEALRRISSTYDPHQYKFVVGIGSEFVTSRVLTFPFLERRKILQSLPYELEDVIPFSQNDAIFDFRTIVQRGTSTKVLAFAVPKRYIQDLLHLCDDAGLSPDIICPDSLALANHFEEFDEAPKVVHGDSTTITGPAQLIVHIGYKITLVDVIQDRALIASRALYFGGHDLTNMVSRSYQLPFFEALKGVSEKGFVLTSPQGANEDQVAFSQTISQGLAPLVSDLQRTIVDLKAELGVHFEMGHLMGGMSRLINLGPYLTQKLEIPFGVYAHLGKAIRSDVQNTEEGDKASSVAVGLAIEGIRKPKNPPVTLRRNEFSKQNQTFAVLYTKFKNVAQAAIILYGCFFLYAVLRDGFAQDNVDALEKAIRDQGKNPTLNLSSSQLKGDSLKKIIKGKKDEIESKKAVMKLSQMVSALDVLKMVSGSIPGREKVTLDVYHFDLKGESLNIDGQVNSQAELDSVQRGLSQLPSVSKLSITPNPKQSPPGKLAFNLKLEVARLPVSVAAGEKQ